VVTTALMPDVKDNALYAFTDTIFALTPLRFQGQRLQMEWHLKNPGAPESARRALEPRGHLHRTLLRRMVEYYVELGQMPKPQRLPRPWAGVPTSLPPPPLGARHE
jgi:hypothetical protein